MIAARILSTKETICVDKDAKTSLQSKVLMPCAIFPGVKLAMESGLVRVFIFALTESVIACSFAVETESVANDFTCNIMLDRIINENSFSGAKLVKSIQMTK